MDAIGSWPWATLVLIAVVYWLASSIENQVRGLREDLRTVQQELEEKGKSVDGSVRRLVSNTDETNKLLDHILSEQFKS